MNGIERKSCVAKMNEKFLQHFRESKSSNSIWNILKTLFQTVIFWTLFLLIIPYAIYNMEIALKVPSFHFSYQQLVSCSIFLLASILGLSSGVVLAHFGKGTPLPLNGTQLLVINGPYRYIRNPMAVAGLSQGVAVGIWYGSWGVILYVFLGMFIWDRFVRPIEEAYLFNKFGDVYETYRKHIKCWCPSLSGYSK